MDLLNWVNFDEKISIPVDHSSGPFLSIPAISIATPNGLAMGFFLDVLSPSPKFSARSETDWVSAKVLIYSLNTN